MPFCNIMYMYSSWLYDRLDAYCMEVILYCASKKRLFLLGLVFFLIMCISGIYSLSNEINETESGLSTSAVDIEIKEFNQYSESFTDNGKIVMPGDEIRLIPKINNLGIECYLRAKIIYTIGNEEFDISNYIDGNYSSWNKKDEYYYYDSIFQKEESVELFNSIKIPNNLSSRYQGKDVVIHIIVEAIQAKNFDGDWTNVTIKKSINRTYNINYKGGSSIIYEHNANNHINLDKSFFDSLGNMVPGDRIIESINILNSSHDKNEYFLTIDYDELSDAEIKMLSNINFVIKNSKGRLIASNNLGTKGKYSLGTYTYNEGDNLTLELSMPKNVDNESSKLFAKIIWRFSYNVLNHYENPVTGDFKFDMSITVFLISTLGFLIVLILGKKNADNIEK